MSKRDKHNKKVQYGKMEVRKYKRGGNHPHVIVEKNKDKYVSVGIQSSNKSGHHKLKPVYESNGDVGYMKHTSTIDKIKNYQDKAENWHIDIDSEMRAIEIAKKSKKK